MSPEKSTLFKVGFHVPGIMAAVTAKGIKLGEPRRRTVQIVKRIQQEMYITCPGCGTKSGVDFSAGLSPAELYKLAPSMEYRAFFDEVERRYRNIIFTCPKCGFHGGRLNVVKELMGHAHISTTAEFYSAVSEEHEAKAQWVIEAITVGRRNTTDARAPKRVNSQSWMKSPWR